MLLTIKYSEVLQNVISAVKNIYISIRFLSANYNHLPECQHCSVDIRTLVAHFSDLDYT